MNTPTSPPAGLPVAGQQAGGVNVPPTPGDTLLTTAGAVTPSSPLGTPPQSVYQVPTVGGAPSQSTSANTAILQPAAHTPTTKSVKASGGFSLLPVLYVLGGIIFLAVYTVVWAVVFDLTLPFGITLPF